MLFQTSAGKFCYVRTIILYLIFESINIDESKKVYAILYNLWICNKNVTSSRNDYLQNRDVLPCVFFVLIK